MKKKITTTAAALALSAAPAGRFYPRKPAPPSQPHPRRVRSVHRRGRG